MTPGPASLRRLAALLIALVASSVLHYVDNIVHFHEYPEPAWIDRSMIDAFWFAMTPLAVVGYLLLRHGRFLPGCLALIAYAACNLLTLGHYAYAPMHAIGARIHAFILLEAVLAGLLVVVITGWMAKPAIAWWARGRDRPPGRTAERHADRGA